MDGSDLVMPRLIVPAYFHPASHPAEWAWLAGQAEQVRLVVLNLAERAGQRARRRRPAGVARLRAAGVPVPGTWTPTTACGRRREALADLGRYLDWYQVDRGVLRPRGDRRGACRPLRRPGEARGGSGRGWWR